MPFPGRSPTPRVLIVNDDVSVSDMLARTLRLEGLEVWGALSVTEGLALAERHRPHAVIVDLRMPLTSSLDLVRRFRQLPGLDHAPAALVTGDYYVSADQAESLRSLGASLHFKPLWMHELVGVARELVQAVVTV